MAIKRHNSAPMKPGSKSRVEPAGGTFAIDPDFKLKQTIKVAVRIRPLHIDPENADSSPPSNKKQEKRAWNLEKSGHTESLIQKGVARKVYGKTQFHFDSVFDEETQTPLLYKRMARPMVKTVVGGKHATIFAYGQTGSGKTFTMQGEGKKSGGQAGIIQLVASDMFRFMRQGASTDRDFVVKVSYIEIYNESIRDLLSDDVGSTMSHGTASERRSIVDKVDIRATASGEVVVNCIQNEVTNVDQVLEYLIAGNAQRMIAKTDMNQYSSRSHAVFRLTVESKSKNDTDDDVTGEEIVRVSDFNLVDLAGSESVKMSNTTGIRLREGAKINQSLLTLSTVIHSLSLPEKKRPKHINYRDSKLTRILQPHLSGNAEIAIVCCISPSKSYIEETRTTLKFAARAKLIGVKPKVNEVLDDTAKIRKLQKELVKYKRMIEEMTRRNSLGGSYRSITWSDIADSPGDGLMMSMRSEDTPNTALSDVGYQEILQQKKYVMPGQQQLHASSPPKKGNDAPQSAKYKSYKAPLKLFDDESTDDEALSQEDTFKLDAVPEEVARKTVIKYMKGENYGESSSDEDQFDLGNEDESGESSPYLDMDVKKDSVNATARTEDETYDGPPASYRDVSFKFGSNKSSPDTLGVDPIEEETSKYGTADNALDGRTNDISWDTMGLNTSRPEHVGQPLRALKSLEEQNVPIPKEVTIISASLGRGGMCITEKLEDAQQQADFLKDKLDGSDDIIESVFRDLERARLCIHDLVYRNVKLAALLKEKRREDVKEEYEEGEVTVEQYWLLKGSMYVGLFFFFSGGYEYFMASVIFIWLILEANMS